MNPLSETANSKLDQLADELAIRALADKFSDAANRTDGEMFQSLWAEDGIWTIGLPINVAFRGKAQMGDSLVHMLGLWDFFVQLTTAGVILIEGDTAYARFYVQEIARRKEGGAGNFNLSMYEDELVRQQGRWYFQKRTYHTIYQDAPTYSGRLVEIPTLPDDIRKKTFN
jgi:ketosteroid isomerase-like protein